jgi:hypothetical protein
MGFYEWYLNCHVHNCTGHHSIHQTYQTEYRIQEQDAKYNSNIVQQRADRKQNKAMM